MDPFRRAVSPILLLPDWHNLLECVNQPLPGFEGITAVWRADGDRDAGFTDFQMDESMDEVEMSRYYFELADVEFLQASFAGHEGEARRCLEAGAVMPAYESALKCSHLFNVLDARGAVSVTERVGLIGRIRRLAVACAREYVASRERLGFPLLEVSEGDDAEG